MPSQATEKVGLEGEPQPGPKPSRLDDWFLGVALAGSQHPAQVYFLPEVHKEFTRS